MYIKYDSYFIHIMKNLTENYAQDADKERGAFLASQYTNNLL